MFGLNVDRESYSSYFDKEGQKELSIPWVWANARRRMETLSAYRRMRNLIRSSTFSATF